MGAHRNRPDCQPRPDPMGTGPAENTVGQDHAPHLRKIAENDYASLGDTSTLADPSVVDELIENRMNRG
jgi:hypothetical protein